MDPPIQNDKVHLEIPTVAIGNKNGTRICAGFNRHFSFTEALLCKLSVFASTKRDLTEFAGAGLIAKMTTRQHETQALAPPFVEKMFFQQKCFRVTPL